MKRSRLLAAASACLAVVCGVAVIQAGTSPTRRTAPTPSVACLPTSGEETGVCPPVWESPFELNRRLGRGMNILGFDPVWESPETARFGDSHFERIKEAGFTSVRVNLHPFRDTGVDETEPIPESWLLTVDWAIERALANQLLVILDLHEYRSLGADPEGNRERFLSFWRQIAWRYRATSGDVLFEVLNEPGDKLGPSLWNQYLREALAVIREHNPSRTVVVGPAKSNAIRGLRGLRLPAGDRNIILTVHYYGPFAFTHQGAPWAGLEGRTGVTWSGTKAETAQVLEDFETVSRWARRHSRPVLLGEFGAFEAADMSSRVLWTSFIAREAERRGWSWAYWQFDHDFIAFDVVADSWIEPIRAALVPPAPT